jgi:transcriptional regulator with XRE-family HTH domain
MSASVLLREARARHGISQRRLALRARTSQDAISRIERGIESPTLERLANLLMVLGERLELDTVPLVEAQGDVAPLTTRERLREANLVATKLEIAGAQARKAGHPATQQTAGRPSDIEDVEALTTVARREQHS